MMTKLEKYQNRINKARNLSQQGRYAEAKLKYEGLIDDLLKEFVAKNEQIEIPLDSKE